VVKVYVSAIYHKNQLINMVILSKIITRRVDYNQICGYVKSTVKIHLGRLLAVLIDKYL
jgi:hypothetical protein